MAALTASELRAYLESAGVSTDLTDAQLDDQIEAATLEWEQRTGWSPFAQTGTPSAKLFDAPGYPYLLPLKNAAKQSGLSIEVDGVALAATEYKLLPYGEQWCDRVKFVSAVSADYGGIEVTADWGRVASWPADAVEAVSGLAASRIVARMAGAFGGSIKQGGISIDFKGMEGAWETAFSQAASRWEREVY